MHVRKSSLLRGLGFAVTTAGVGAFLALPASAEPPTFNNREPRPPHVQVTHDHAPHAPHKPALEFHPEANDHPQHKNPGHPLRVIIEHVPVHVHAHKSPARVQIQHTITFPVHKPHVNVSVGQVNRVLPQHKPHVRPDHVKTSIDHTKPKSTQPEIIKIVPTKGDIG